MKKNTDRKTMLPKMISENPTDEEVSKILSKGIKEAELDDVKYAALDTFIPAQYRVPPMPAKSKKDKK